MDRRVLFLVGLVLLIAVPAFLLGNDPEAPPPGDVSERDASDPDRQPTLRGTDGALTAEDAPVAATSEGDEPAAPTALEEPTVPSSDGVPVRGRVVRASDGTPVAGAKVRTTAGGQVGTQIALVESVLLGETTTDQDGVFRFPSLPPSDICTLTVSADGFRTTSLGIFPGAPRAADEALEVQLEPGGRVEGRVFDPDGAPYAGARVCLDLEDDLSATTDAHGSYRIEGLVFEQRYGALASPGQEGLAESAETEGVFTTETEPVTVVDLVLRRPGTLVVLLVDEDGKPVEVEGEVALGPWPFMGWLAVRDEARGHAWRFGDVNPGNHRLQIEVKDYKRVDRRADVSEGEATELAVTLSRGEVLAGLIVDDRGEPVAGAWVSADAGRGFDVHGESDAAGRFRLRGLRRRKHTLRVGADGHVPVRLEGVAVPADDLRVQLDREAIVVVRLRLPVGTEAPQTVIYSVKSAGTTEGSGYRWPRGAYRWPVPRGPVTLTIEGEGFAIWSREVDMAPGETLDLGTAVLETGVTLEVLVTDAASTPIAGADVKVVSSLESWRLFGASSTGIDGVVRHEHLHPGAHRLEVIVDGYLRRVVPVTLPERGGQAVIVLARGGLIHGRVLDLEGAPVENARVRLQRGADDPEWTIRTDEIGRFDDRVPPGRYTVSVLVEGKALDTRVVEVAEGGEVEVVFQPR